MQKQHRHWLGIYGPWALTTLLSTALVFAVVDSVARSNWAAGLGVIVSIALGGIVVSALFARLRWLPGVLAHLLSAVLGVAWTVARLGPQMSKAEPALLTWRDHATELLIRTLTLGRLVFKGGTGEDLLLFVALLGLLVWALAYASVWMLARHGWAWSVVLLNAVVLFINLTYASPKPPILLFFLFTGAALLVIVQQTFLHRARTWDAAQMEYPDFLGWRFVMSGLGVVLALLIGTTLLPTRITAAQVAHVWEQVRQPWENVQSRWDRTFSNINAPANAAGGGFGTRSFTLQGARRMGDQLVMEVKSSRYEYWRVNAFDRYNGGLRWENTTGELARATLGRATNQDALTPLAANAPMPLEDRSGRQLVTQQFTLRQSMGTPLLFAATQPISVSLPTLVEHSYLAQNGATVANFGDMSLIQAQQPLSNGTTYTVQSLVGTADKASLRTAVTNYPEWAKRYLQLPPNIPQRLQAKADEIAASASNPYDKAEAIEKFLRGAEFQYDEQIPNPPENRDVIDYFVFDLKHGYCDYFASSMVMMLRMQGVPARIAQGFAGGEPDPLSGVYKVTQRLAHTWPEVYFPGFGWQRFEPTPAGYTRAPQRVENAASATSPDDALSRRDFTEDELKRAQDEAAANDNTAPLTPTETAAAIAEREAEQAALTRRTWQQRGIAGAVGLFSLLVLWGIFRRPAPLGPGAQAYGRVLRWAGWAGLGPRHSATPHEVARSLSEHLPHRRAELETIATSYTREQYATPNTSPAARAEIDEAWRMLRWPLFAAIFGRVNRPTGPVSVIDKRAGRR